MGRLFISSGEKTGGVRAPTLEVSSPYKTKLVLFISFVKVFQALVFEALAMRGAGVAKIQSMV